MKKIEYKNHSIISQLKNLNKIDDQFVFYIENLSLEELISIKLESTLRSLNFKFFNFPLWHNTHKIVSEALVNAAINLSNNNSEASRLLGLDLSQYRNYLAEFGYEVITWEKS